MNDETRLDAWAERLEQAPDLNEPRRIAGEMRAAPAAAHPGLSIKQVQAASKEAFAAVQAMPDDRVNGETWDLVFARLVEAACAEAWGAAVGVPVEGRG